MDGAPEKIRTSGLQLRRLPLYPAELRAHLWYQQLSKMTSPTNPEDSIQNCYYTRGGSRESHAFKIPDGNNPKGQKTQRNCLGVALPGRSGPEAETKDVFGAGVSDRESSPFRSDVVLARCWNAAEDSRSAQPAISRLGASNGSALPSAASVVQRSCWPG